MLFFYANAIYLNLFLLKVAKFIIHFLRVFKALDRSWILTGVTPKII